jgi:sulfate adenylyltransferase subunit 2
MGSPEKERGLDYLDLLESESVHILRETAAQFQNPAILFSGGKDSACLVHLASKAFAPARIPFILFHVDTGHNFAETLEFRDRVADQTGAKLLVRLVQDTIDRGKAVEPTGPNASRNALQAVTLMDAIAELGFDALVGGARRDEEKARAKERIFSVRDEFGQWDPKSQRPELWALYNGRIRPGDHMRVFPLSNWTELDVWHYIKRERIELPTLYFSHKRETVRKKSGSLLAAGPPVSVEPGDQVRQLVVRCRTVGDMTCTGLVESAASSLDQIIEEITAARTTERGTRVDDRGSETSMEDRKKKGYF